MGVSGMEAQDGFAAHLAEAGAEGAERHHRPGGIDPQVFAGALIDLQRTVGNGAVVGLMSERTAQTRTTDAGPPVAAAIPADSAPAGSAVQREAADPWGGGTVADREVDPIARARQLVTAIKIEGLPTPRFSVPREATIAALTGLTADDGRALAAEFERRTRWNLRWLISGEIELGDGWKPGNNLAAPVRKELLNLLEGTVAPAASAPTVEATGTMLAEAFTSVASLAGKGAEARQIREAVAGSVGDKLIADAGRHDQAALAKAGEHEVATQAAQFRGALKKRAVDEALELLRRPKEARDALDAAYRTHYGQPLIVAVTTLLSGNDMMRAIALLNGDEILADRLALEGEVAKRDKAEAEAALLERFAPGSATDRRREARGKVEARLEGIARTGHLEEVLGPDGVEGELAAKAGADKDAVAAAIIEGKGPELLGARLARIDAEGSIKPADVEDALRRLTAKADSAGRRLILRNPRLEPQAESLVSAVRQGYFARFEAAFDNSKTRRTFKQVMAGQPASFNDLMSSGGMEGADLERNRALFEQRGKMDEWQVVYYALKREPKDIDRVREILDSKTEAGVVDLARAYAMHLAGRSLELDLLGTPLEQRALETLDLDAREGNAEKRELLRGGQFEADPRDEESVNLKKEGDWLFTRIAGLERRVMENRGLFAEARDWVGNIEQELVALERGEAATAKAAFDRAFASTPADLNAARTQVSELRRINRRLKHAVKVYKVATKEAFEAFVDFAVEIAATIATAGQGGIILQAIRATAARIGTKMILKGDDYSAAEFLADLQDGLTSAGSAKIMKHTYAPLAKELAAWAGKKGWSNTLAGKVAAQIAAPAAEEFVESGISNKLQGKDFTEGWTPEGAIKGVAKGHAVKAGKAALDARKGMQLGPAGRGDAGEQGVSGPGATHDPVTDMELGPAGRGPVPATAGAVSGSSDTGPTQEDINAHFANLGEGDLAAANPQGANLYSPAAGAVADARFSRAGGSELDVPNVTEVSVRDGPAPLQPGDPASPARPADLPPETWLMDPARANITDPTEAAEAQYRPNRTGFDYDVRNAQIVAGAGKEGVVTPSGPTFGENRVVGGARGAELDPATGTWQPGAAAYERPHNPLGQDGGFVPRTPDEWNAWEQTHGPLTDEQRYAVWFYADDLSGHVNPALRGSRAGEFVTDPVALAAASSDLDRTMQPVPFDAIVHRKASIYDFADLGVKDPSELVAMKGQSYAQQGYTSTAVKPDIFSGDIDIVIEVPKGTRGRYLGGSPGAEATNPLKPTAGAPLASMPSEMEFLIERGTSFTIQDARQDTATGRWTVEVRVAEQGVKPAPLSNPIPLPGLPPQP